MNGHYLVKCHLFEGECATEVDEVVREYVCMSDSEEESKDKVRNVGSSSF